jgi:hypothetical protein
LARLSVKIWTLNAQSFSGIGHPPCVMLQDGRDVVALESQPGFA